VRFLREGPDRSHGVLQDVVSRFAFDAICEFLFGTTLHTLDSELLYPRTRSHPGDLPGPAAAPTREVAFSQALVDVEKVLYNRLNVGELWPLQEFFKDKTEPYMELINAFLSPLIEDGLAKHAAQTKAGVVDNEGKTLLDSLLQETSGSAAPKNTSCAASLSNNVDMNILRDEILNILVAGRDSVSPHRPFSHHGGKSALQIASVLTFLAFLLSLHPEVFERLRAEVLEVVGPAGRPTYENIREMKYLRAVLNGWPPGLLTMVRRELTISRDTSSIPTGVCPLCPLASISGYTTKCLSQPC
jgi:hypothetical protein